MSLFSLLLINLAAATGIMTLGWIVSLVLRRADVADVCWGLGFMPIAWLTLSFGDGSLGRKGLVTFLVTAWAIRLAVQIGMRNAGKPEDRRYRAMRETWGDRFPMVSLFTIFLFQALLLWIVALPIQAAGASLVPRDSTWLDRIGTLLWLVGFFFEALGDWQMYQFKSDPANKGRVMDQGLWRFTRHPNYFGEACMWWGITCIALATPHGLWTLPGPILITFLLLRVSGVSMSEKGITDRRPGYAEYKARTNTFFPWFPKRFNHEANEEKQ